MERTSKPRDAAQDTPKTDPAEIERALRLILPSGQVTELRALDAVTGADRRPHTESGYFDDPAKLAEGAAKITAAKGIYFIPNLVQPALLARSLNKARAVGKAPITSDADIVRRLWQLIDCDAVRPAGIAASDDEHHAALVRATDIDYWLAELRWPTPIIADSGNGGHLLYRIDLPADDGGLVERCLKALARRLDDEGVTVDTSVFNPARIWRLYGCVNRKGEHSPEIGRPHRPARILNAPDELAIVTREQLEALAAHAPPAAPKPASTPATQRTNVQAFDLAAWIDRHKLDVTGPDPWQGGQKWIFKTCPWNSDHTNGSAYVAQLSSGAMTAGCHHNSCQGRDWHALRDAVEPGWRERGPKANSGNHRPPGGDGAELPLTSPGLVNLADVTPRDVRWLWPGRIPLGKLTLIAGEPGQGKSFLTLDIAAHVTTGNSWPDLPNGSNPRGSVVLLSAEDDVEDTIRPRLDASGADVRYVTALQGIEYGSNGNGNPKRRCFNLECDLPALEQALDARADCRLIVIDPVSAFVGGRDSHKNSEIRGLLAPLADLAGRRGVAVVAVTHLNKAAGIRAMHRVTGSLAFIAAARAGWLVTIDKNDPKRRLLLPIKNNLAADVSGLAYAIIDGALAWERGPVSVTADDALADDPPRDGRTQRDEAVDWLRELLADGPLDQADVTEAAKANGFTSSTLRRAKAKAGVKSTKRGNGKDACWSWSLPATSEPPKGPKMPKMLMPQR
jgi:putative DNA primase/helicase